MEVSAVNVYPRDDGREDLNRQVARIAPYCAHGRGLDVGCGSYKISERAIGLDRNPLIHPDLVHGAIRLPFPDQSFDFVAGVHSLPCFPRTVEALREWTRVLKVGGHLCIVTRDARAVAQDPNTDTAHLRHYTPEGLRALMEEMDGLEVIQSDTIEDGGSFDLVCRKVRHVPGILRIRGESLGLPAPRRQLTILMYSGILYRKAAEDLGHNTLVISHADADMVVPYNADIDLPAILDQLKVLGIEVDLIAEFDGPGQFTGMERVPSHIPKIQVVFHCWALHRAERGRLFDHNFITQKSYLDHYRAHNPNTHWLPHAADPDYFHPVDLPEEYDVGFLGHTYEGSHDERKRLLSLLAGRYRTYFSYGYYFEEASRVYARCRMIFNRSSSLGDLNQRPFEVMSCGRLVLTDRIDNGLPELFRDREHLVTYGSDHELLEAVEHYLNHPEERRRIAEAGRHEVLARHTYAHRMDTILRTVFGS